MTRPEHRETYLQPGSVLDENPGSDLSENQHLESLTAEIPAYLDAGWKWVEPMLSLTFERKRGFAVINRYRCESTGGFFRRVTYCQPAR